MDRIFIQIASYRDPDLPNTIDSALTNADEPQRLRFGICWQYDEQTYTDLDRYLMDPRFRVSSFFYEDSNGCCWARRQTNLLYQDEEYMLQIDAHTRFAPHWDTRYLNMLLSLDSAKPLLTTYPAPFERRGGKDFLIQDRGVQRLELRRIRKDLTTVYKTDPVENTETCPASKFIAAGQIFTLGRFCTDIPYDPELYFAGEEINLAVRAYTHGYDFFCPNEDLIWHRYQHGMPTHWRDHDMSRHDKAVDRLHALMVGDHSELGEYSLGRERTLADYERLVEIDFTARSKRLPTPVRFRKTIQFDLSNIESRDDYHFWIFTLRNVDDEELYRYDIYDKRVLRKYIQGIEIDELLEDKPVTYMLWPNVRGQGFLQQNFYEL